MTRTHYVIDATSQGATSFARAYDAQRTARRAARDAGFSLRTVYKTLNEAEIAMGELKRLVTHEYEILEQWYV